MSFHAANLSTCQRMQNLLAVLKPRKPLTGWDIHKATGSLRVSSDISELRANLKPKGLDIVRAYVGLSSNHRKTYTYTLTKA